MLSLHASFRNNTTVFGESPPSSRRDSVHIRVFLLTIFLVFYYIPCNDQVSIQNLFYSCNLFENESCSSFSFGPFYAMIANMAKKAFEPKRPGFFIRPRYIILFFILTFFVLGGVYLSQQTKLQSIAEEKVTLQTELDSLKVEEERLERMLEYMQTTDYLIQYAREKLGYVFPDDWKFYDPNEEAEVTPKMVETPTPLPALTTPSPGPSSTPTPLARSTPDDSIPIVTLGP